nr:hypothetical protein [Tanacetum cinerariifolium]
GNWVAYWIEEMPLMKIVQKELLEKVVQKMLKGKMVVRVLN